MKKGASVVAFVFLLIAPLGCQHTTDVSEPVIHSSTILSSSLPKHFDEGRVFQYNFSQVNPESVLIQLWSAGIPVVQAWLPLDNQCMDLIGPRFTVELAQEDLRIVKFDFTKGSGRLGCATMLKRFIISK